MRLVLPLVLPCTQAADLAVPDFISKSIMVTGIALAVVKAFYTVALS